MATTATMTMTAAAREIGKAGWRTPRIRELLQEFRRIGPVDLPRLAAALVRSTL